MRNSISSSSVLHNQQQNYKHKTIHATHIHLGYIITLHTHTHTHTHAHTRLTALCLGLHGWAGTRKVKPIWILLKQETVSGSGIRWAICKSSPRSSQKTMPAPHHSVFYRPDALPAAQPTVSKHWRHYHSNMLLFIFYLLNSIPKINQYLLK